MAARDGDKALASWNIAKADADVDQAGKAVPPSAATAGSVQVDCAGVSVSAAHLVETIANVHVAVESNLLVGVAPDLHQVLVYVTGVAFLQGPHHPQYPWVAGAAFEEPVPVLRVVDPADDSSAGYIAARGVAQRPCVRLQGRRECGTSVVARTG